MKKVFSNSSDTIHRFAQRTQDEGRSSNVFFEGDKIYSYGKHYLLGQFIDKNTIIINNEGYSVTTSKHINEISFATRQYKQFFTTKSDLNLVHRRFEELKDKLSRARKPELYINEMLSLWDSLNDYINYRKLPIKRTEKYKSIKAVIKVLNQAPEDYQNKLAEVERQRVQKIIKQNKKLAKDALQKFFSYKIDSFRLSGIKDHIRISQDKKHIETSQAVKVPINEAKTLYSLIKAGKDVKGHTIDGYTVISINGTLKIGCHEIDRKNVNEIGEKIINL